MSISQEDFPNYEKWTRCYNPKLKDVLYPNWKVVLSASDRVPCRVGLVVSVTASHTVGREFASRPGHTKDHHKNCLPVWHAMR